MYFLSGWVNLWLLGGGSQQHPRVPLRRCSRKRPSRNRRPPRLIPSERRRQPEAGGSSAANLELNTRIVDRNIGREDQRIAPLSGRNDDARLGARVGRTHADFASSSASFHFDMLSEMIRVDVRVA